MAATACQARLPRIARNRRRAGLGGFTAAKNSKTITGTATSKETASFFISNLILVSENSADWLSERCCSVWSPDTFSCDYAQSNGLAISCHLRLTACGAGQTAAALKWFPWKDDMGDAACLLFVFTT